MTPTPNASNHRPDQVMFTNFLIYGSGVLAMVMAAAQTLGLLIAAIPSFGITCLMLPLPLDHGWGRLLAVHTGRAAHRRRQSASTRPGYRRVRLGGDDPLRFPLPLRCWCVGAPAPEEPNQSQLVSGLTQRLRLLMHHGHGGVGFIQEPVHPSVRQRIRDRSVDHRVPSNPPLNRSKTARPSRERPRTID